MKAVLRPLLLAVLCVACPLLAHAGDRSRPLDLVLVLDNSGSMQRNDPRFGLRPALARFIDGLDRHTRLGIVVYDRSVRMPLPLTALDAAAGDGARQALQQLDYRGQRTDTPAAIERAVYELARHGRPGALKAVAFVTDGIVDTGDPARDRERAAWLREDVAAAAADAGVRICGVAFTEAADVALIQSLARRTAGDYFRVADAAGLASALGELAATLRAAALPETAPPLPESAPEPPRDAPAAAAGGPPGAVGGPSPPPVPAAPGEVAPGAVPAPPAAPWWPWVAGLALVALAAALRRRGRPGPGVAPAAAAAPALPPVPKARLIDRSGATGAAEHELGGRPTLIGRIAGGDADRLDYLVIDRPTVGRRHALIEYRDLGFWVTDLGSANGTFVNGERIGAPVRLRHGDRIRLHTVEFEFVLDELEGAEQTVHVRPAQAFSGEATVVVRPDGGDEAGVGTVQPPRPGGAAAPDEVPEGSARQDGESGPVDLDLTAGDESTVAMPAAPSPAARDADAAAGAERDLAAEDTGQPGLSVELAPEGEEELATWMGDATALAGGDTGSALTEGPLLSLDEADLEAKDDGAAAGGAGAGEGAGDGPDDGLIETAVLESAPGAPGVDAPDGATQAHDGPEHSAAEDTTELGFAEFVEGDLDESAAPDGQRGPGAARGESAGAPVAPATAREDESAEGAGGAPGRGPTPPPGGEDPPGRQQ